MIKKIYIAIFLMAILTALWLSIFYNKKDRLVTSGKPVSHANNETVNVINPPIDNTTKPDPKTWIEKPFELTSGNCLAVGVKIMENEYFRSWSFHIENKGAVPDDANVAISVSNKYGDDLLVRGRKYTKEGIPVDVSPSSRVLMSVKIPHGSEEVIFSGKFIDFILTWRDLCINSLKSDSRLDFIVKVEPVPAGGDFKPMSNGVMKILFKRTQYAVGL